MKTLVNNRKLWGSWWNVMFLFKEICIRNDWLGFVDLDLLTYWPSVVGSYIWKTPPKTNHGTWKWGTLGKGDSYWRYHQLQVPCWISKECMLTVISLDVPFLLGKWIQFDMFSTRSGSTATFMVEMLKKSYEQIGGSFVVAPLSQFAEFEVFCARHLHKITK